MSLSMGGELLYHGQKGVTHGDPKPYVVPTGWVSFTKSSSHDYAEFYTAHLRVSGNSTIVASQNLGVPAPDAYGTCVANILSFLNSQSAGNYTISIATTTPGGTTDSAESNVFVIPVV